MSNSNTYRLRTVLYTLAVVFALGISSFLIFARSLTPTVTAAPSTYLNFQARLKTNSGGVVPDGNYNIEFKLYNVDSGGTALWTETRTTTDRVRVANGYFSVSLGSVTAFPGTIAWGEEHWITMNIGGTGSPSWDGEMNPRLQLTAVPYAFKADVANALTDGTNNYTADDFLKISPGASQGTSSSNAAVRLNQTGAGGLLQLQSGGTDMLTLSNTGDLTLAGDGNLGGDLTVDGTGIFGGTLTIGYDTGGALIVLDSAAAGAAAIDFDGGNGSNYLQFDNNTDTFILKRGGNDQITISSTGLNLIYGNLSIGTADTTGQLLVLDTKTDSSDPTGVPGGMYYNSNLGKFRCFEGPVGSETWKDCIGSGGVSITTGDTASRPGSPTESQLYYDTDTDRLLVYSNGKWQADRVESVIVAASNSSQADKDAADYIADGNGGGAGDGDQVQINAALTAASGKKVVLLAGAYVADATILIPNNTTLTGVGTGTVIELADLDATDNLIENSDTSTGTGVVVRDLKLDGRDDLNTTGTQIGVYFSGMGSSTRTGGLVINTTIEDFRTYGMQLSGSGYNSLTNNTIYSNGTAGIYINGSSSVYNALTANTVKSNGIGIQLDSSSTNDTLTGNNVSSNTGTGIAVSGLSGSHILTGNTVNLNGSTGISLSGSNNTVTGNTISSSTGSGISLSGASNSTVASNKIYASGNTTANNGILLSSSSDYNSITDNSITDTSCTTTCYAISISDSGSDKNYLEGNRYSGSSANAASINDAGTGTIYVNQQTNSTTSTSSDVSDFTFRGSSDSLTALQIQNASGVNLLTANTSDMRLEVGGDLEVVGSINSPFGGIGQIGNSLPKSEELDDSGYWTATNITVAGDAVTDPRGETTAETLTSSASGTHTLAHDASWAGGAGTYTFSIWVKTVSGTQPFSLRIDSVAGTPTTGTVRSYTASTAWKRYTVTQTFTGSPTDIVPVIVMTNNSATIAAWGAQMVLGTSPGVYTSTTLGGMSNLGPTTTPGATIQGRLNIYDAIYFGNQDSNGTTVMYNGALQSNSSYAVYTNFFEFHGGGGGATKLTVDTTGSPVISSGTDMDITVAPNGTGNLVVGTSNTTGTQFVLDTKTDAGDPTGVPGGMYYNASLGKFRCFEGPLGSETWKDCVGSSGTVTLQSAYTGSTGGTTPEVKLDSTRGGLDIQDADSTINGSLLTVRASNGSGLGAALFDINSTGQTTFKNSTNSATAFQIQNASGASLVTVNTGATTSLANDGSFEYGKSGGWIPRGDTDVTVATTTSQAYTGSNSLQLVTNTLASNGAAYPYKFLPSTQYSASVWMKRSTGSASTFNIGYAATPYTTGTASQVSQAITGSGTTWTSGMAGGYMKYSNGSTTWVAQRNSNTSMNAATVASASSLAYEYIYDVDCLTSQTISTTWTNYTCTFTTPSTVGTESFFYVKQTDTTTDTVYIDNFTLVQGATAQEYTAPASTIQVDATNNALKLMEGASVDTGVWKSASPLITGRSSAGMVYYNGYAYTAGGYNGSSVIGTVEYAKVNADGTLGAWATTSALPAVGIGHGLVAANGYLYALAGGDSGFTSKTTVYFTRINADGTLNTWQTEDNLPYDTTDTRAVYYKGYFYIVGGWDTDGGTYINDYMYAPQNSDGTIGSWTTVADVLPAGYSDEALVAANGYIYSVGGSTGGSSSAQVLYARINANGTLGTWATTSSLPAARTGGAAVVSNGFIYLLGGKNTSPDDDVYYAKLNTDGTLGTWQTSARLLPTNLRNQGAFVANGRVYLAGGRPTDSTMSNAVYYAQLGATVTMSGNLDLVGSQGGNLADSIDANSGSAGGSITAGNGTFIGALAVQGTANFNQGVSVNGTLNVAGGLAIGTIDTTGTLLVLDTKTNSGDPTGINGAMYYNSNTGKFRCYENGAWKDCISPGNTAGTRVARLIPEFEGMVMRPDGSSNVGFLTADFCSGSSIMNINASACGASETRSYYDWTTSEGSAQDYDMYVRWRVPDDFSSMSSMSVAGYRTTSSDGVSVSIFDATDTTTPCVNGTSVSTSNAAWTNTSLSLGSCSFSAGDLITVRIKLTATSGNFARLGDITIGYNSNF